MYYTLLWSVQWNCFDGIGRTEICGIIKKMKKSLSNMVLLRSWKKKMKKKSPLFVGKSCSGEAV